ncbi:sugar transporter [Sphingomonas piscis]|uniref:Sugar transporter n=2 Tax=Sphingomonas piscis TaxID=2714943 RepID=A0A6G7YTH5_9SPHN|nr:sugar transporter [Sphingomonas piscis]
MTRIGVISENGSFHVRLLRVFILAAAIISGVPMQAAAQPGLPAAAGVAYRINPGDELEVLVWGEERLQRTVRVLPDGTFAFPLVGQISAAGRLPAELERTITIGLQPQYKGEVPRVSVSVKNPSGFQFSVIGKVKGPGTFTPGRYVNALEALSIGGGPTEFADLSNIRIVRKAGSNLEIIRVKIGDALRGNAGRLTASEIPQIISGDTLVVP